MNLENNHSLLSLASIIFFIISNIPLLSSFTLSPSSFVPSFSCFPRAGAPRSICILGFFPPYFLQFTRKRQEGVPMCVWVHMYQHASAFESSLSDGNAGMCSWVIKCFFKSGSLFYRKLTSALFELVFNILPVFFSLTYQLCLF